MHSSYHAPTDPSLTRPCLLREGQLCLMQSPSQRFVFECMRVLESRAIPWLLLICPFCSSLLWLFFVGPNKFLGFIFLAFFQIIGVLKIMYWFYALLCVVLTFEQYWFFLIHKPGYLSIFCFWNSCTYSSSRVVLIFFFIHKEYFH